MAGDLNVSFIIRAIDRATAPMRKITGNFAEMQRAASRASKAFQFAANTRQAAAGVNTFARALRGALLKPINEVEDFDKAMSRLAALSGAVGPKLQELREQQLLLGRTTEYTATAAARAAGDLAMKGFKQPQILKQMPTILNLATAAEEDLSSTATIATSILRAFDFEAKDMPRVADALTTAFTNSGTSLSSLGETMQYAASTARNFHLSIEQTATMAGILSNVGHVGSEAGTAMRNIFLRLTTPIRSSQKAMEALGVSAYDQAGNLRPILQILADIKESSAKMTEQKRNAIFGDLFGVRALGPAMDILNRFGSGELRQLQKAMDDAGGATERTATIMRNNGKTATDILMSAVSGLNIAVGEMLEPSLNELKTTLTNAFDAMTTWARAHPQATKWIFGTVGAVAILTTVLGSMLLIVSAVGSLFGFAAYGIGGLKTALILLRAPWTKLIAFIWTRAIPTMGVWIGKVWASASASFAAAAPILAIAAAIAAVTLAIVELIKHWEELDFAEAFKGIGQSIEESGIWQTTKDLFDPRTMLRDIGIMSDAVENMPTPKNAMAEAATAVVSPPQSMIENVAKRVVAPQDIASGLGAARSVIANTGSAASNQAQAQQVGGKITLEVQSAVPTRVKRIQQEGNVDLGVNTGPAMVTP